VGASYYPYLSKSSTSYALFNGIGCSTFLKYGANTPSGTYSQFCPSGSNLVYVIEGACPSASPTPPPASNTISGSLSSGVSSGVANLYRTNPGARGVASGAQDRTPVASAPIQEDGSYTFSNIPPGNYQIEFKGDGATFNPPSVSVSLEEDQVATAPASLPTEVNYNDEGCTTTDVSNAVIAAVNAYRPFEQLSEGHESYYSELAQQLLKGKKRTLFLKKLSAQLQKIDGLYSDVFVIGDRLPIVTRTLCPKSNLCETTSYAKTTKALGTKLKAYLGVTAKLLRESEKAFSKKKTRAANKELRNSVRLLAKQVREHISALPKNSQICPEASGT
jgi:hypothetical protein